MIAITFCAFVSVFGFEQYDMTGTTNHDNGLSEGYYCLLPSIFIAIFFKSTIISWHFLGMSKKSQI